MRHLNLEKFRFFDKKDVLKYKHSVLKYTS